jgi:hypothetical protein
MADVGACPVQGKGGLHVTTGCTPQVVSPIRHLAFGATCDRFGAQKRRARYVAHEGPPTRHVRAAPPLPEFRLNTAHSMGVCPARKNALWRCPKRYIDGLHVGFLGTPGPPPTSRTSPHSGTRWQPSGRLKKTNLS